MAPGAKGCFHGERHQASNAVLSGNSQSGPVLKCRDSGCLPSELHLELSISDPHQPENDFTNGKEITHLIIENPSVLAKEQASIFSVSFLLPALKYCHLTKRMWSLSPAQDYSLQNENAKHRDIALTASCEGLQPGDSDPT